MAHTSIPVTFPVFAPMRPHIGNIEQNSDGVYPDWIMCLWRDDVSKADFCEVPCGDFMNFIGHLEHHHGIKLRPSKDYCSDCCIIFHKLVNKDSHESSADLMPIFEQIKEVRKVVLDQILFPENMPELQCNEIFIGDLEVPDSSIVVGDVPNDTGVDISEFTDPVENIRETRV